MGAFRLNESFINKIEKECQNKAKNLAHEASNKLTDHYLSLLNKYYKDYTLKSNKYNSSYYVRTSNLYKSSHKYYKNNTSIFYGGVRIDGSNMNDYKGIRNDSITGQDLLDKFIYNKNGTWHGGDWHGGYGEPASFNIYNKIHKYRNEITSNLQDRCKI